MKALKVSVGVLGLLVVAPIWYWLLYQVLTRVQASELMWFLYWVYVPVALLAGALQRIVEAHSDGASK